MRESRRKLWASCGPVCAEKNLAHVFILLETFMKLVTQMSYIPLTCFMKVLDLYDK